MVSMVCSQVVDIHAYGDDVCVRERTGDRVQ